MRHLLRRTLVVYTVEGFTEEALQVFYSQIYLPKSQAKYDFYFVSSMEEIPLWAESNGIPYLGILIIRNEVEFREGVRLLRELHPIIPIIVISRSDEELRQLSRELKVDGYDVYHGLTPEIMSDLIYQAMKMVANFLYTEGEKQEKEKKKKKK